MGKYYALQICSVIYKALLRNKTLIQEDAKPTASSS